MEFLKKISDSDKFWVFLLFTIWLFFFRDLIFFGKLIFYRDVGALYYPYKYIVADLLHRCIFPFWNPYINCGEPILSNPQYMVFYPTYFFFYIFKTYYFFQLHFLIHILIASVSFYFFIKYHLKNKFSSFISAFVYSYNGFSLSHLLFQNLVVYLAILPLLLIFIRRVSAERKLYNLILLSFFISLLIFAMEPFYFIFSVFICVIYMYWGKFSISIKRLALLFLMCFSLSSLQVLPTLYLLKSNSTVKREPARDKFKAYEFTLLNSISGNNFFSPEIKKNRNFFYYSFYLGGIFFFIFFYGFLNSKRKEILIASFIFFFLIFLSMGGFLYKSLMSLPPFSWGRFPVKFIFPIFFLSILFFSRGIYTLIYREIDIRKFLLSLFFVLSILMSSFFHLNWKSLFVEFLVILVLLVSFLFFNLKVKKIFLFFLFFLLYLLNFPYNFFLKKPEEIFKKPEYLKFLDKSDREKFRISPDFKIDIYTSFSTKNFSKLYYKKEMARDFYSSVWGVKEGFFLKVSQIGDRESILISNTLIAGKLPIKRCFNIFSHTGVRFLISPIEYRGLDFKKIPIGDNLSIFLYDLKTPPIYHFTERVLPFKGDVIKYLFRRSFDDRRWVFIEKNGETKILGRVHFHRGKILSLSDRVNDVSFKVLCGGVSFFLFKVVNSDGWRCFIDGRSSKIYRVNGIFQGCIVPEGVHTITFRYIPEGITCGVFLFLLWILISIYLLIVDGVGRKNSPREKTISYFP